MLSPERILQKYWRFYHEAGHVSSEFFMLCDDGTTYGHQHDNERFWEIKDGVLCLLNKDRKLTVRFETVEEDGDLLTLKGPHLPNPTIVLCLKEQEGGRLRHNVTRRALEKEVSAYGWLVGDHTYGVPTFLEKGLANFTIGKYCSIAGGVKIALGDHRTDTFTTYPFGALKRFWQNVPSHVDDHSTKGGVIIGNDVWIGTDVFIGSGVNIGDGAILGAKAVVVKDVPPYAIVVGNPGRIARYRFSAQVIDRLTRLRWWDLDDNTVDSLLPLLMSKDVEMLLESLEQKTRACRERCI
jgi:acetyltransferase-like isoleucine patch superfamily enzyme